MAAISSAQHKDFCDYARKQLSQAEQNVRGKYVDPMDNYIAEHINMLEGLFEEYQNKVKELYEMIARYETVKKKARIQMRKQVVSKKDIDAGVVQNLTIKKAS